MSGYFTITRLGQAHEWASKHGPMVDYWLAATDGHADVWCFTTRKPDSAPPKVGEQVYGHIENQGKSQAGKDKLKLVKDQVPDGFSPPTDSAPQASSGSRSGGATASRSAAPTPSFDTRSARIERQHSQEMALRAVAFAVQRDPEVGGDVLKAAIKNWTDWFCEDLDAYQAKKETPAAKVNGAGGDNGAETPTLPAPLPNSEVKRIAGIASNFDESQVKLRLVAVGATDVSDIPKAIGKLSSEQGKLLEKALEDIAAEEITQAVEETQVPAGATIADNDEIPF